MRTAADVVARGNDLLRSLEVLVDSTRAIDLPSVAGELGVAETAATLTEALVEVLRSIREQLHVVTALSQLGALFGLLEPLVDGLRGVMDGAGRQVAELGLGGALPVSEAIASGFRRLQDVTALGSSLAISPVQLQALRTGMNDVIAALEQLAEDFHAADAA